jgi:hypothetical protein
MTLTISFEFLISVFLVAILFMFVFLFWILSQMMQHLLQKLDELEIMLEGISETIEKRERIKYDKNRNNR